MLNEPLQGHDVIIVDNLSRRNIDTEMGCDSLTPIQSPEIRVKAWKEVSGRLVVKPAPALSISIILPISLSFPSSILQPAPSFCLSSTLSTKAPLRISLGHSTPRTTQLRPMKTPANSLCTFRCSDVEFVNLDVAKEYDLLLQLISAFASLPEPPPHLYAPLSTPLHLYAPTATETRKCPPTGSTRTYPSILVLIMLSFADKEKPDAVIHFAEQRAAPYSMKG